MDSENTAILAGAGMNAIGALISAYAQGRISEAQFRAALQQQQAQVYQESGNSSADYAMGRMRNRQQGFNSALGAMGGPHDIQRSRQQNALQRALLFGGPGGRPQYVQPRSRAARHYANIEGLPSFQGAEGFFSDQAMANAEEPFWQGIAGVTGGALRPNLSGVGYGPGIGESSMGRINTFADEQGRLDQEDDDYARGSLKRAEDLATGALNSALGGDSEKDSAFNKIPTQNRDGSPLTPEQQEQFRQQNQQNQLMVQRKGGNAGGRNQGRGLWGNIWRGAATAGLAMAAPYTGGASLGAIGPLWRAGRGR